MYHWRYLQCSQLAKEMTLVAHLALNNRCVKLSPVHHAPFTLLHFPLIRSPSSPPKAQQPLPFPRGTPHQSPRAPPPPHSRMSPPALWPPLVPFLRAASSRSRWAPGHAKSVSAGAKWPHGPRGVRGRCASILQFTVVDEATRRIELPGVSPPSSSPSLPPSSPPPLLR